MVGLDLVILEIFSNLNYSVILIPSQFSTVDILVSAFHSLAELSLSISHLIPETEWKAQQ